MTGGRGPLVARLPAAAGGARDLVLWDVPRAVAAGALVAGFSFSYGSVVYETGVQRVIAPERLGRVSAYSWMASMTFLPLGYAAAGWIGELVGSAAYLVVGAVWIAVTTSAMILVSDVRNFRLGGYEAADVAAPAAAT